MNKNDSTPDEGERGPAGEPEWRVDREASRERLRDFEPAAGILGEGSEGALVYTDEDGVRRHLPADRGTLSGREIAAAANATARELGAPELGYAKIAAIERLNEMRIAGLVSEENYLREKRRITELD